MNKKSYFYSNLFAWGLVLFLITNHIFGWTTPTEDPPGGNIELETGATPAGSTGHIQFNDAGNLSADSNLFWDNSNKRLGIGTTSPESMLHVNGNIITPAPTADNHVATKAYVDASSGGGSDIIYYSVEPTPTAYAGNAMGGYQGLIDKCINAFGEGSLPFTPQILSSAYYGGPPVTPVTIWSAGYYWYSSLENKWDRNFTGYGSGITEQEVLPEDWFNSRTNCNAWTGGSSSYGDCISIDSYNRMSISSRTCTSEYPILCAVPHY